MTDAEPRDASARDGLGALAAASRETADAFLSAQTELTRLQIEDMEREEKLRFRSARLRHLGEALKVGFELSVALIALLIAAAIASAVWNAARDNGLVVESFSVPPELADKGLTGQVVAARILDRLSALQAQTVSHRAASSYANNWGNDIKVQIPDTGISIGDFNRYLHQWLGHETHITGEIYRAPAGLAVTARAGSTASPTFTGADLDKLLQQAAEAVYAQTQPYRYAVYLMNTGRAAEAKTQYDKLIATGSTLDRAWAYIGLGNYYQTNGDTAAMLGAMHRALAIRPDFVMAYSNIAPTEGNLGHDEVSLDAERRVVELLEHGTDPDISVTAAMVDLPQAQSALASDLGDFGAQLGFDRQIEDGPDFNNQRENALQNDVVAYGFLHDAAGMRRVTASFGPAADPQAAFSRLGNDAFAEYTLGHWQVMLARRAMFDAALAKLGPLGRSVSERQYWPVVAHALALAGDFAAAHRLIDKTPTDCTICLRARGNIDAAQKNWGGADYWFARAAAYGPSIPFVWTDWGAMLLAKGDADAAIAKFKIANRTGPHFADPLEMWGEALMKKNRSDLALAKFAQAAKYAPRWGRLHLKWGEALFYSGDRDGAAKQFAAAADLSAADRAEWAAMRQGGR